MSLRYLLFPQLKAVADAGWESLGISAPGPWVAELVGEGIRHISLDASTRGIDPLADLRAARQLLRILRRERPDVLHTHNPKPGLYGRLLGRLSGVPIVINTVHGLYATEDDPLAKRALVYLLEALAARFSDVELVQNPEDLELMRRLRIAPPAHARLLGNGVDVMRFDPETSDRQRIAEMRQDLGVEEGQLVIGMVGRLVAEKGYPELFEAVGTLDPRYVLVCIGPHDPDKIDSLDSKLLERARDRGVRFLGMRQDVEDLYAAMDLFVLPSHREGFPRAAMEAAAMRLPIVATDIRGCRQVVEHEVNGLLVPVADPLRLADAIRRLGDDDDLRSEMGNASREKALAEFDERRVVQTVMDTYREIASRKGMVHLLADSTERDVEIRAATATDAPALAMLHSRSIESGFLPRLGFPFLRRLYRAMIGYQGALVLVADDGVRPVGFVAGAEDVGAFYRYFVRHHGVMAGLAALPRVVMPANLRRAWESLRYGTDDSAVAAELLAMAVVGDRRGQGLGHRLGQEFLTELVRRGATAVRVVVGAENTVAISAYRKMGFSETGTTEVHAGEKSTTMTFLADLPR